MKKKLLLATSLFLGGSVFAQFTDANTPVIGNTTTLYIIDSLAPNLEATVGAGVEWDYSAILGYENEQRTIEIEDPATTGYVLDYPFSTEAQDLEGFIKTFYTSDASKRESHGFVFTEQSLGDVVARYTVDPAQTHIYPMNFGDAALLDDYEGEVDYSFGFPQTSAMFGNLVAVVDGEGTLKLAGGNDYTNVLRYKIVDTMRITVQPLGQLEMQRVQYEYYDLAAGNLPIFVHTNVKFGTEGGTPMLNVTLALSKDQPTSFVSVSENELERTLIYPNPASESLKIQLPSSIDKADVVITDALGREVYSSSLNSAVQTIDVTKLNKGMYFVNISNDVYSTTKNVVIK